MMTRGLFFLWYRFALWPLLFGVLHLAAFKNSKIRRGLQMRQGDGTGRRPWLAALPANQRPIWIHCASMEFEYAKPVITEIKAKEPRAKILVTYFSPTVAQAAERFPGVDAACPSPWESAGTLQDFIDHHRPQSLLIARTDTWPEMLRQSCEAKIPSLLFSATIAKNSGRAKGLGKWISKTVFNDLSQIFCVSEGDREVFESLGCTGKVKVAGDTRYDQVQTRLSTPKALREELFQSADPVLVAGSTWAEDESVLIETAKLLSGTRLKWILVPHEPTPTHLEELEGRLHAAGLSSLRYSSAESWNHNEIMIIDQVGILAELYLKGRFAFVGGSFKKTVHSVMEPLAAGCLTFVGPLHDNNREALEFRTISVSPSSPRLTSVLPVTNAETFASALREALESFDFHGQEKIRSEIKSRSGKSELVAEWALERWRPTP